ncbi:GNAT family N-acetyltransferase [Bacillus sp. FJAT-45350]|uniref:GNAT family N-acetyltransferase n=1 Tax=Bacillus sp. FJAT-45350 TaxID=2011014 RepID=UPI000BB9A0C2|nr:GNAT family N-acetyltransferase [Bacillus sp. FJAT-45350]
MVKNIRMLNSDDYPYLEAMDTGLEDDYVERIFDRLTSEKDHHRLFGLFLDNQMVSMGGYSIFAGRYAMLGRLRSDRRFRGNNLGTELISYIMNEALKLNGIQWVGANTQESNNPARRVVDKLGLKPYVMLHGAITKDTSALVSGAKQWSPVVSSERKLFWIREVFLKPNAVFPYECYYSFPASDELFQRHVIEKWSFYENEDQTRVLITKYDQKGDHYLHVVYPWSDIASQKGLWETISDDYDKLKQQTEGDTYIWMDLTKEDAESLPVGHKFELPSPWILYGREV